MRTPNREALKKNASPPPAAPVATAAKVEANTEDQGVHSGSEEGEIEED
jgi:pre-mRNA-processing factor 40